MREAQERAALLRQTQVLLEEQQLIEAASLPLRHYLINNVVPGRAAPRCAWRAMLSRLLVSTGGRADGAVQGAAGGPRRLPGTRLRAVLALRSFYLPSPRPSTFSDTRSSTSEERPLGMLRLLLIRSTRVTRDVGEQNNEGAWARMERNPPFAATN